MKANTSGYIVGYALGELDSVDESGIGSVIIIVRHSDTSAAEIEMPASDIPPSEGLLSQAIIAVQSWFLSIKEWVLEVLTAEEGEAEIAEIEKIQMIDSVTGMPTCLTFVNGEWATDQLGCSEVILEQPATTAQEQASVTPEDLLVEAIPEVIDQATTTPELQSGEPVSPDQQREVATTTP